MRDAILSAYSSSLMIAGDSMSDSSQRLSSYEEMTGKKKSRFPPFFCNETPPAKNRVCRYDLAFKRDAIDRDESEPRSEVSERKVKDLSEGNENDRRVEGGDRCIMSDFRFIA